MNQLTQIQQVNTNRVPDRAKEMIDRIFENLAASCPILLTISKEQLETHKQQWILGFAENGIKTFEQIKRGMTAMRAKPNGYLPSVGEFIQACKVQDYHALGLPNEAELYQRYKTFLGYARFNRDEFQYRSKVEFWLLKNLYEKCKKKSEEDTLKTIPKLLTEVAEKVRSNFPFEDIPKMIPVKPSFYDKAKADKARDSLMAMMKGALQ